MSVSDFKCYDANALDFDKLDPGIREVVRLLISMGFETTDSGDGKHKVEQGWDAEEVVPFPHVFMKTSKERMVAEADRLVAELAGRGVLVGALDPDGSGVYVEATYLPGSDIAIIGLFGLTGDMVGTQPSP